ncbi:hypothetical protein [Methylopila sp. M107]|uniref:CopG family ribbon-helix-helix protein n=1 Tax=Methylopila sp. M107 TaxID=1101190 RepID=UPI000363416F|nr:hypothetical protein [Methylopila sp. M107]
MADSTTLTVRLPVKTKEMLARLADHTDRKQSFLGAAAITDYVTRELAIVEAIERGMQDAREGRTIPHDEVMAEMRAIIDAARTKP